MNRGLVVIRKKDDVEADLLTEAGQLAECNDAPLLILRLLTPEEYQSVESVDLTSDIDRTGYEEPATSHFDTEIEAFIEDAVGEHSFDFEIRTKLAEESDQTDLVLDTADDADCDHIFIVGKRRSPTGKAIFGDLTQEVILEFEGAVTLLME